MAGGLRVQELDGRWVIAGGGRGTPALANEFLGYLADPNYSPRTVRGYAFDLLHFARWLDVEDLRLDEVTTEDLLRYLAACRSAPLLGRPGGNVYSIRDGRNAGYAPATINRRLAAISGLFAFRAMRDPTAPNPVPRGREARFISRRRRGGLLGHLSKPKPRSAVSVREPRRLPRSLDADETAALMGSFRTWRDRATAGLMLFSGLRGSEVLALDVADVDIGRGLARVIGKGNRERSVPVDSEVAGIIQTYLLEERPETDSAALFVVMKGPNSGERLSAEGLRAVFRYHRRLARVPAAHPHALRHTFGTALAEAGVDDRVGLGGLFGDGPHRALEDVALPLPHRRLAIRSASALADRSSWRRVILATRSL